MPFFSVILPTYNRARMAAAAALSVLGQTERDFELFLVDDGSTDDTRQVLSRLPKAPNVRLLRQDENQGQLACRNLAIRRSSGAFVTFLDSDDLYLPDRLAVFRKAIEERPSAGFWLSNSYVRRYGVIIGRLFPPGRSIPEGKVPGRCAAGEERLPYAATNLAIRREAFDRFGVFREDRRLLEDAELYARMLAGGLEVGALHEALAVRCLHEAQLTRDRAPRWRTFVPTLLLDMAEEVRRAYLTQRYAPLLAPQDFRRAERLIRPYLDHASTL